MTQIVGIGNDIVECLRIAQMIERHGELFLNRVFTAREVRFCSTRKHATQHFAAHWAGKEALLKSLGSPWRRGLNWRDLEIISGGGTAPTVELHGQARVLADQLKIKEIKMTLAHCRSHATAQAIALGD